MTVYPNEDDKTKFMETIPAEENTLEFVEPYILAMAANNAGETGS